MNVFVIYCLIFVLSLFSTCLSDDILGCGGFVKSDVPIRYSRVEIKLYTKQGSLKYQTDCAPNNGYYLIPLYDKGDYVLKVEPPVGWSFEPSGVSLRVDGSSDPCSLGQDINFVFRGFSLSGKVVSKGTTDGPSGIHLALRKLKGETLQETLTEVNGKYTFLNVMPGNYLIEANHPTWSLEKSQISVTVTDDSVVIDKNIEVAGYDVTGQVISEGEPIKGVHFLLFTSVNQPLTQEIKGCKKEPIKSFARRLHLKFLCYVSSDDDGRFTFPSLPSGNYKLIPFYKGEYIEFDVHPSEIDFLVEQGSVIFHENFQVQGFSVSGKIVVTPGGKGISGAKIYLDGKEQATSQENGIYHLENMKTGMYKLEVKVPYVNFDPIVVKITPNTPQLPEVVAMEFSLCGEIMISQLPRKIDTGVPRRVSISWDKEEISILAEEDGKFCAFVKPGTYVIKPVVSSQEEEYGLKFSPTERRVTVLQEPVLSIRFVQYLGAIKGTVKCLQKCSNVQVLVTFIDGLYHKYIPVINNKFVINDLFPGKYEISALKEEWCWKRSKVEVTIESEDVSNVVLEQIGYHVTISPSHSTRIRVVYPSKSTHEMNVEKGISVHCFPEVGVYELTPVGCHVFQEKTISYDTENPSVLQLIATKHILTGIILSEENVSDIILTVNKHSNGDKEAEVLTLGPPQVKNGKVFSYKFAVWVQPYTNLDVEPSSGKLLFRPPMAQIHVLDDCMEEAFSFKGISGLFINGDIVPPLEDVKIEVKDDSDKVVANVRSDKLGKFSVGPLDSELSYEVSAEKEGYILKRLDKLGHFKAFKLAEVNVFVENESKEPLSGVLLSLSGGVDYRKNSVTQQNGQLSFLELSPGQYFLRPMLKEYQFVPSAKMIEVTEGATIKIKVSGKRVAFSCYGIVNSLTGEAEPGVIIEAVGAENSSCSLYQEEAVSEQDGSFRIRGLQPKCEYTVRLKMVPEVNQHIERATPKTQVIKIESSDVTGIRLIVFRHFNQMDVSGNVVTNQEYLHTLKVRLFGGDALDQAVHTITLGQNSFFQLPPLPLDNRTYMLRLDTSLPGASAQPDSTSVVFPANQSYRHFTLHFRPLPQAAEQEMTQGSLVALPLTLVVISLLYNYNKILPVVGQIFQTLINPARTVASGEGTAAEPAGGRRKTKPRKAQ
uniref:Nodal modulator n=1 Tax=Centruroides hentzi TaxID=88313 RepID=A0A2I9LPE9_9SCOR